MQKMILIDQDGPLADWEAEFLNRWKEAHPELPFLECRDRRCFHAADDYAELVPVEERESMRSKVKSIFCAPGFYEGLPPVEGAKDALLDMLANGFDVGICTSPLRSFENCVLEKYKWVEKHLGPGFTERIILCRRKALVRGDYLIDDRPDAAERDGIVPAWQHIVFDAPYNRHIEGKVRLNRWSDWRLVLEAA